MHIYHWIDTILYTYVYIPLLYVCVSYGMYMCVCQFL